MNTKINWGMDSCGSGRLLAYGVSNHLKQFIEPCESGLFSSYFNTKGEFFPCSFVEGTKEWEQGIDLIKLNSFKDLWQHKRVVEWRNKLLNNCRNCPVYKI